MAESANSARVEIFKFVVNSVAAVSVTSVTRNVIRNNVATNKNRVEVGVAMLVVSHIVFDYVWKNTDAKFNALVEGWNSVGKKEDEE